MSIYIKRIVLDTKEVLNDKSLINIHYIQDENIITRGYALIIGTKDTPYEYGNFLFEFNFPENYPFSPPKVSYHTNDNNTRFHPNLYINGYICLSILNTWAGEKWSSCQSLRSILITISSILDNMPLLYEPGICINHPEIMKYNKIVKYKKYEVSIIHYLNIKNIPENFKVFHKMIENSFINNYDYLLKDITHEKQEMIKMNVYNMSCNCDYDYIKKMFNVYKLKLIK